MISVSKVKIDPEYHMNQVEQPEAGAVVTFSGNVRNHSDGRQVIKMEYEADENMAEALLKDIADEAKERFEILSVSAQHRTGELEIGEVSVFIAVSAAHRKAAFDACQFMINRLKEALPIWKKEYFSDGPKWVDGIPVITE